MMQEKPRYRLGVDVGGTHTDLVLLDAGTGALMVEKVASTPRKMALDCIDRIFGTSSTFISMLRDALALTAKQKSKSTQAEYSLNSR